MTWDAFMEFASQALSSAPTAMLLIHLGGNDLPRLLGKSLILCAKADLLCLFRSYPHVRVLWSEMLPRLVWKGAQDPKRIDQKCVNREVGNFVHLHG
ncbi:hypothetical protein JRQ81_010589, partial [Phrynocephalus forsythii]